MIKPKAVAVKRVVYLTPMKKQWTTKRRIEHLIFWVTYWLVLTLSTGVYDMRFARASVSIGIQMPVLIISVYIIVYYVIPVHFQNKRYIQAIGWSLAATLVSIAFNRLTTAYITYPLLYTDDYTFEIFNWYRIAIYVVNIYEVVGIVMGVKYFRDWNTEHIRAQAISKEQRNTELNFLRAQVHPHFLFNTLNSIYNEILKKSSKAGELMIQLSDLLRFTLYECREQSIPVEKELKVIQDYISIEMNRIGQRLKVKFEILGQENSREKLIPPMLFLSIVENSFKHGVSNKSGETEISILVELRAECATLSVRNPVLLADEAQPRRNKGIGLDNIVRQLELIYGDHYEIDQKIRNKQFMSWLKIPYIYTKL